MVEFRRQRIKELRESFGLTLDEMARKLDKTTMQSVSNWENGVSEPTMKSITLICNTFDVDPSFFFDDVSTSVEEVAV